MPANLENSAVATGLEKISFHSSPKERQCQRMFKLPHNCKMAAHTSVLAWRIPGTGILVGCRLWGHTESDTTEVLAAAAAYANKVMLKILQARLPQNVNQELPGVQARFRKGRGTRDQIANICWIIEKARELKKKKHQLLLHGLH